MKTGHFDAIYGEFVRREGVSSSTGLGYELTPSAKRATVEVELPERFQRLVVLVDCLLCLEDGAGFQGGVLNVGDVFFATEQASVSIFNKIRELATGSKAGTDQNATGLGPSDRDDLYDLLLVVLCGRWDATYIPADGRYQIQVSHDGFVGVRAADASVIAPIVAWLKNKKFLNSMGEAYGSD